MAGDFRCDVEDDCTVLSLALRGRGIPEGYRLRMRAHGATQELIATDDATAFVPLLAVASAVLRQDLLLDAAVDPVALAGAETAAGIMSGWFQWRPPRLAAAQTPRVGTPASGVGLCFSRGVDSLHALSRHRDAVTHLLGIDWIDSPPATPKVGDVWKATQAAADELGLPLLHVSTNLRSIVDEYASWGHYHGAVLAGFGLMCSPVLGELLVGSTSSPQAGLHEGSTAVTDPLWSSSLVSITYAEASATRLEKCAALASWPFVARWLKVCWERDGEGNCGQCSKCLLTMSEFHTVGAWDRIAPRFDAPLSLARLEQMADGCSYTGHLEQTLDLVRNLPQEDPLLPVWRRLADCVVGLSARESQRLDERRRLAESL